MLRQYLDNINRNNILFLFVFQITGSSGILPTISIFHFEGVTFNALNEYKPSDYTIGKIYYYNKTTNLQNYVKLILIFELVLLTNIPEKAFEIPPSHRWTPLRTYQKVHIGSASRIGNRIRRIFWSWKRRFRKKCFEQKFITFRRDIKVLIPVWSIYY